MNWLDIYENELLEKIEEVEIINFRFICYWGTEFFNLPIAKGI